MAQSSESLFQERTDGRRAHHVETDVKQSAMKDAAREDAIYLVLINNISRAESKVLKVEIQNGLQNEYTGTETNDEAIGQRN